MNTKSFSNDQKPVAPTPLRTSQKDVEHGALKPHPLNQKIYGSEPPDPELVDSIKRLGILEPLVVTQELLIVSGHRRWLAAKEAGIERLPVIVCEVGDSDTDVLESLLEANRQRKKTNWQLACEAKAYCQIEIKRAKERQGRGGQGYSDSIEAKGAVRNKIGEKIGCSGRQVDKLLVIKTVVDNLRREKPNQMSAEREANDTVAEELTEILNRRGAHPAWKSGPVQAHLELLDQLRKKRTGRFVTLNQWKDMTHEEREAALVPDPGSKSKPNTQKTDSVEWALETWNPITGCTMDCPYCYAADNADRYYEEHGFEPTFHPDRLLALQNKQVPSEAASDIRYKNVFVCSQADILDPRVPEEWVNKVVQALRQNPQWNGIFLTKIPGRIGSVDWPDHSWVGVTVDRKSRLEKALRHLRDLKQARPDLTTWISFEPLLERMDVDSLEGVDGVVIGGASSSKFLPAWQPPATWVDMLIRPARESNTSVFIKTNTHYRPVELPGQIERHVVDEAPPEFFQTRSELEKRKKERSASEKGIPQANHMILTNNQSGL